ncbi:MAG TPA: peptidoglycan DD-metalloendopeptidase family protein [Chitinophagaceae bacterium]
MQPLELIVSLKRHQQEFLPVIPFDPSTDKLLPFDLSPANKEMTEDIFGSITAFSSYINRRLKAADARYGIGGYNEYRTVYSRSKVFDAAGNDKEPRRLHLGTDIWGKPYTRVMAPLDGLIHSFAFNNNFGDYGVTIILSHSLNGSGFYTLYGHLSLSSVKNIQEDDRINKGDVFAEFGIPSENGHWPPHLHFQIIGDIGDWKGNYPGVCKYSEREKYLNNSPDPDLVLQLDQYI